MTLEPCVGKNTTFKRVGYGRVSTAEQTTAVQEKQLKDAGCDVVFVEKVSSRVSAEKREQLMAALETLEKGDTLVVAKLDRLGRTQVEVVNRINQLTEEGIHLKTLDGLLDTAALGRMAPLVIGLLTGLAEVERSLIRERTLESVAFRRSTGGNLGGRPPVSTEKVAVAARLRQDGCSYREIGKVLGISHTAAIRILKREVAVA